MFDDRLISSYGENIDRNKKYLIFGDSHSQFFTYQSHKYIGVHLYKIHEASMAGFGKRESTLKVADKIRQTIYDYQVAELENILSINLLNQIILHPVYSSLFLIPCLYLKYLIISILSKLIF